MINPDEMMRLLIEASPSFEENWKEFVADWEEEKENLPHYLILSEFADHMVYLFNEKDLDTLNKVFTVVESLHTDGDDYVKLAATVGLLEDFQCYLEKEGTDINLVEPFLGPESLKWWRKLTRYLKHGESLTE